MSALIERARQNIRRALASGTLEPLSSAPIAHRDGGISFLVRRLREIPKKPSGHAKGARDPFVPPYEPDLFVEDRPPEHAILLNRYPVLDEHLLLVTRRFEDQESYPSASDLSILQDLLAELDGLAFYNGGALAGASQPHRHLQIVPRAAFGGADLPTEPAILAALGSGMVPSWPFLHTLAPVDRPLPDLFERLCAGEPFSPFSMLCTRRWMLLVPRSRSHVEGIPVNSLGYAGSLVVKDDAQQQHLERVGALSILADAGVRIG